VYPALLALVTFASAAAGDVVEAYFVRAVADLEPHRAARMSIAMYAIGCIGWFITLKISLWYMLPEVAGLYVGSYFAISRQRRERANVSHLAISTDRTRDTPTSK
jgi:hypothetical protein